MQQKRLYPALACHNKEKPLKIIKSLNLLNMILLVLLNLLSASCGKKLANNTINQGKNLYSKTLFGANYDWKDLAGKSMQFGDLIRDRSFRSKQNTSDYVQVWGEIANGGTIVWNTTGEGDINPAGGRHFTGYVELSRTSVGYTGITQQLITGIKSGNNYSINFSSYGVGSAASIQVCLYSSAYSVLAYINATAVSGEWTRHELTLTPGSDEDNPIIGIFLTDASTVRIDEVRISQSGGEPAVSLELKTEILDLVIKALRWPGGTLGDWFIWSDSIGNRIKRGELRAYGYFETPALGLHEFLNLCLFFKPY